MTTHLVTFSDESMRRSAELCVESAKRHGMDNALAYSRSVLELTAFYEENQTLLGQTRGCGYFAWKPYVIHALMGIPADLNDPYVTAPEDGDILVYADAGIEFLDNVNYIIDRMDQDIFLFANMWEHAHWCKRDIIDAIMPGAPWEAFGKQVQASVIFFRVTDYARAFLKEWLDWCLFENGRLIDDSPSRGMNHPEFQENRWDQAILTTLGYREGVQLHYWPASYCDGKATYPRDFLNVRTNHPEFKENRHDQAILTTMAYRERLGLHRWPARYNLGTPQQFDYERGHYDDDYPTLFNHHRKRNHEWEVAA